MANLGAQSWQDETAWNEQRPEGKGSGPIYTRRKDPLSRQRRDDGPSGAAGPSSAICRVCNNLGIRDGDQAPATSDVSYGTLPTDSRFDYARLSEAEWHHPATRTKLDYYDVAESADLDECKYCCLIYQCLMAMGAKIALNGYSVLIIVAEVGRPFYVQWDDESSQRSTMEIYRKQATTGFLSEIGTASDISMDPASDEVFDKIRKWVKDCETGHPECAMIPNSMPRCLLYLGKDFETSIRLVEDPPFVNYAALSHCWGGHRGLLTTRSNLEQHRVGIAWTDLPKTFQHAIITCQKLGIEHIWIDSLCIIQDDQQDWELESARMGDIYEGAHLTISAATAQGDAEGFLDPTDARSPYMTSTTEVFMNGLTTTLNVRQVHDIRTSTFQEPTALRGWTLQENYLSRRLLTFTTSVTFECKREAVCECGNGLYPDPLCPTAPFMFGLADRRPFQDMNNTKYDAQAWYDLWYNRVTIPYLRRSLTNASDCLPAISAIASRIQRVLPGDKYLAGMWLGDLKRSLFWASSDGARSEPTSEYIAPSWSWASLVKGMQPLDAEREAFYPFTILEAECTPRGADAMGAVSSGHLRLLGFKCEVMMELFDETRPRFSRLPKWRRSIVKPKKHGNRFSLRRLLGSGRRANDASVTNEGDDHEDFDELDLAAQTYSQLDSPIERVTLPGKQITACRTLQSGQDRFIEVAVRLLLVRQEVRGTRSHWNFLILAPSPMHPSRYERLGRVTFSGATIKTQPDPGVDEWFIMPLGKLKAAEVIIV